MSSSIKSIRDIRDQRHNVRTVGDRRGPVVSTENQKTYDARLTAHSSSSTPHGLTGEPSRTDQKVDHIYEIISGQLAPRIKTLSANAVLSDRRLFYYYFRKRTGRRCSCFASDTSPESQCPVCLGTGIVGGFEKYGTKTEVIDFTTPNLVMVNCEPSFDLDTRPVYLRLKDGYDFGYVEGQFPILNNIGKIDTFMLFQPIFNHGTRLIAIDPLGNEAVISECKQLEPFLAFDRLRIRIEFTKGDARPLMSHFMLRYMTQENLIVHGDIPTSDQDLILSNTGLFDAYQEISIFFDAVTVTQFNNEDVLYRLEDGRRFKVVTVNDNRFGGGTLTSTVVKARFLIQGIDHINQTLLI